MISSLSSSKQSGYSVVANNVPSRKMLQKSEKDLKWIAGMCEKVVDIRRV
jgi:hypothetical protein